MNFPTDYDTKASTFGDIEDNLVLTLAVALIAEAGPSSVTFTETALVDLMDTPSYLTIEGNDANGDFEILRVTAKGGAGTGVVTAERGALGTTSIAHALGAKVIQDPVSGHLSILRGLVSLAQKFHAKVGTSLPATCVAGEAFLDTSTGLLYLSTAVDTWTLVNRANHHSYANLGVDDHPQYHTEARKLAWHDVEANVGGKHLTTPSAHNHDGSGANGAPAARLKAGPTAGKPATPTAEGQLYFDTTTGDLYFANSSLAWERYSVMPVGTIILFEGACPQGWTRVAEMDGKFPRGAAAGTWSGFSDGGTDSHVHTLSSVIAHTHSVAAADFSLDYAGGHSHSYRRTGSSGGYTNNVPAWGGYLTAIYIGTSSAGGHSHTITIPAHNTASTGSTTVTTGASSNLPPYVDLLFCKKS